MVAENKFSFFSPVPEGAIKRWHVLENIINENGFVDCAEIGVMAGRNIAELLERCPQTRWHAIDPWEWTEEYKHWTRDQVKGHERKFDQVMDAYPDRVVKHKLFSSDAAWDFEDESLDFLFIDGDHSYEGVKRDIELWTPKVYHGGIIAGHDWRNSDKRGKKFDGVEQAIREALSEGIFSEQDVMLAEDSVWWVKKI